MEKHLCMLSITTLAVYIADVFRDQAMSSQSDLAVDLRFAWLGHLFQSNGA